MPDLDDWFAAMRRGDFGAALRASDAALIRRDPATRDDPRLPYHQRWVWDGRPFDGRRVLVRCYHGLGDTLQHSRFLAPLRARAAGVVLEAQPELRALLDGLADEVVAFDQRHPLPPSDVDVEIMELSHALRLGLGDVPPPALPVAAEAGGAIGLCWQAGGWDADRSLPLASLLAALPARARLVSLQRGPAAEQARDGFVNPGDADPDVARTARLIAGCACVVTVDTMVAHLAGTLGAPTLLLLRQGCDWRWGEGEFAPGYPSVRLLRQAAPGDWSAPLQAIGRFV